MLCPSHGSVLGWEGVRAFGVLLCDSGRALGSWPRLSPGLGFVLAHGGEGCRSLVGVCW